MDTKIHIHLQLQQSLKRLLTDAEVRELKHSMEPEFGRGDVSRLQDFLDVWTMLDKSNKIRMGDYNYLKWLLYCIRHFQAMELVKQFEIWYANGIESMELDNAGISLIPFTPHGIESSVPPNSPMLPATSTTTWSGQQHAVIVYSEQSITAPSPAPSSIYDTASSGASYSTAPSPASFYHPLSPHLPILSPYTEPQAEEMRDSIRLNDGHNTFGTYSNAFLQLAAASDETDKWGRTPLHEAACRGHLDIVDVLLEKGAARNVTDNDGETPLHLAAMNGHLDIVKVLLESGAASDVTNDHGWTPLHLAAMNGHLDTVKVLLEKGAASDVTDKFGETPLHLAAMNGHLDTVKVLLEKGALSDVKSNSGYTPLHWAADNGHLDIVKVLLEKGAVSDVTDNDGWTPLLQWAAENGHLDIVKVLLEKGAASDVTNDAGLTPVMLAELCGHRSTADYITNWQQANTQHENMIN